MAATHAQERAPRANIPAATPRLESLMSVARKLRSKAAVGVAVGVLAGSTPAHAEEPTTPGDALLGIASGVCTLAYTPLKILYATAGLGVGSLVWMFSAGNTDTMNSVLRVTAGGDYVVTPDNLRGTRVLRVVGRSKRS